MLAAHSPCCEAPDAIKPLVVLSNKHSETRSDFRAKGVKRKLLMTKNARFQYFDLIARMTWGLRRVLTQ